jgi:hypothetical protein
MADTSSPSLPSISGQASYDGVLPTDSGINPAGLVPTGSSNKKHNRAITDVSHIFVIIGMLEMARRSQNEKNGRIQAKLNSERPYTDEQLKAEGLGYKSNFSTKPLSTTVGKVASRLTKAVQAARYLTAAELPDSIPDAKKKTELFRREFTNTVRKWPGWYNSLNETNQENAVFGWAVNCWLDETTWKPVFFRQDRSFLPDGTKQSADSVQFAAFSQFVFPHELAEFISDRDAAETAGWDIENTVKAINNARPPSIPGATTAPYTDFRRYEDAIRESSVSLSLVGGAKQIRVWHVFATEIDGQVSHYIADGDAKTLMFSKLDRFKTVDDCLAVFSYEQAATLMGSKGIGREVYELANILDRARNESVDRLQMSGKILVSGPENKINRFKLTVLGNVALIPEGFTISQNKIESSSEDFLALDQHLTGLLDQIAGGVSPRTFDRERVTKTEVDLFASREEEKRDDITTRCVMQWGNGPFTTMQRRMFSPDCTDADAKAAREKLLRYMSEEELKELADQPALQTIEDFTQNDAQRIVLLAQESRNDPLYDHTKMEKRKLSVLVDADFAEDVLLPQNDQTEVAEQTRAQLEELLLLEKGVTVPVSPRDGHLIHIAVLKQAFQGVGQKAGSGDPQAIALAEGFIKHWESHLDFALQSGIDKQQLAPMVKELKDVAKHVGELQAEAQAKAQGLQPGAGPVGAPGAGPPPLAAAPSPQLAPAPVAPVA